MKNEKTIEKQAEEILQNTIAEELIKVGYFDQMEKLGAIPVGKLLRAGIGGVTKGFKATKGAIGTAGKAVSQTALTTGKAVGTAGKTVGVAGKKFVGPDNKVLTRLIAHLKAGGSYAAKHPRQIGAVGLAGAGGIGTGLMLKKKDK